MVTTNLFFDNKELKLFLKWITNSVRLVGAEEQTTVEPVQSDT